MAAQPMFKRRLRRGKIKCMQLMQVVDAMAQEWGSLGLLTEIGVHRHLHDGKLDTQDIRDQPVIAARLHDLRSSDAKNLPIGGLPPGYTQDRLRQICGKDRLLQEIATADQLERLARQLEPGH